MNYKRVREREGERERERERDRERERERERERKKEKILQKKFSQFFVFYEYLHNKTEFFISLSKCIHRS
jgi:hypothetical protein